MSVQTALYSAKPFLLNLRLIVQGELANKSDLLFPWHSKVESAMFRGSCWYYKHHGRTAVPLSLLIRTLYLIERAPQSTERALYLMERALHSIKRACFTAAAGTTTTTALLHFSLCLSRTCSLALARSLAVHAPRPCCSSLSLSLSCSLALSRARFSSRSLARWLALSRSTRITTVL